MPSTNNPLVEARQRFDWRSAGLRYYGYSFHLRQLFGFRVQRVSIDAGFTCPNVDGTVAVGGCTFCDNRSFSPSRRLPRGGISQQIDEGIRRLKMRYKCDHFTAYFQPATNTYAPVDRLREVYEEAVSHPDVVAMAVGTRADCVPDNVLDLLEEMAGRVHLTVEYGMQTMHNKSLDWMNRGEHHDSMLDAVERSRGRGFDICGHIMLGLPGESHADMMATADEVARLDLDAVKIHNLYAVNDTPLAEQVRSGEVELMDRETYICTLLDFLERLPARMIIERISGEAPPLYFLGPAWAQDKPGILRAIDEGFALRDSFQGKNCRTPNY
ncbi:MAG: TIGR01212 family radical SAM protein [Pirellulaceae bacterium]